MQDDEALGLRAWIGHTHGMAAAHRHLDLELNYVLSGTMTYLIGGEVVTLPRRRLCALWGAVPHQTLRDATRDATPAEVIWLTVPLEHVLGWKLAEPLLRRLLSEGVVVEAGESPADAPLLRRWVSDLECDDEETRAIVLLEVEARLRRQARNLAPVPHGRTEYSGAAAARRAGLGEVEALARFVAGHYQQNTSVAQMARAVHLHPNYAMTLFRRHTGMTLHSYLTLQRVAHAQRLLATTRQSIVEIGLESGFGSVSRFYEAFQQRAGCSPRQFRLRFSRRG
jgi:AraC-like DNA-binding protein